MILLRNLAMNDLQWGLTPFNTVKQKRGSIIVWIILKLWFWSFQWFSYFKNECLFATFSRHGLAHGLTHFFLFYPTLQLGNLPTLQNVAEFIIWQMLGRLKWWKKVLELNSESQVPKLVKNVNFLSNRIKDSGQRVKKFSKSRLN